MKQRSVFFNTVTFTLVAALIMGGGLILPKSAQARPPVRGRAHVSVHHHGHANVNKNVNVNVNKNVHVDHYHHDDYYHHHHHDDFAAGVVAGAITGLAVGAIVSAASMPPANSCTNVIVSGISYRQCGPNWYKPCYQGTTVQYVVVNPPR